MAYHSGMPVQAIFLDLDGTLLDYDARAWADTVRAVCGRLGGAGQGPDPGRLFSSYTQISASHFRAAEQSGEQASDGHAIWRRLWQQALAECGWADGPMADRAVAAYQAERAARYRLYDDVRPALARLRQQVTALVLITNGPGSTQRHKVDTTGLARLLDAVITSGEAGAAKPDPAIFELAAAAAGVPLAAAWHVGDSLTADIAGASNAGLGAGVWLNRAGVPHPAEGDLNIVPHFQIGSLSELPRLVGHPG